MTIAIVGRGNLGQAVSRALSRRGHDTEFHSRSTGFDVTDPDPQHGFGDVEAVVEATDHFTVRREEAAEFFEASTRAVAAEAQRSGARHILVSIVNCDDPDLARFGYYAAKARQERVARKQGSELTIVRTTQWFTFPELVVETARIGPVSLIPQALLRPVDLDAAAEVIAAAALGERPEAQIEVCGPQRLSLWALATALKAPGARLIPLPMPGRIGAALRRGALAPEDSEAEVAGPEYRDWLRGQG